MTHERDLFEPGDTVPETGVYGAIHDSLDGIEHAIEGQNAKVAVISDGFPVIVG
jgi:hypothetical protein